jgi:hypothetical protein
MPRNTPEERIRRSYRGENLKSRKINPESMGRPFFSEHGNDFRIP